MKAARQQSGLHELIQSAMLGEIDNGLLTPLLENRIGGGILFLSGSPRQRDVYIRRATELGVPYVLFGESRAGNVPSVTAANRDGAFRPCDRFDPAAGEALAEALLELREPPTAIVAANDVLPLGVFRSAHRRQLRIPDDLAVTGFNDFDFSAFLNPAMTTVSVPMYEMGRAAGRMVVDQLEGADGERTEEFSVEVLIRQSS